MSMKRKTTDVLGIPISAANFSLALDWVAEDFVAHRKGYSCFVSVHGLMEAYKTTQFAECYAGASLLFPDGAPVAWVGRGQGEKHMERVAGPEFMLKLFGDDRFRDATHFLYGGEEGVAELLRERISEQFPHAKFAGTYTPPFRSLTEDESNAFVETIARLKPDIIWVGIGCPKQEQFMQQYLSRLDTVLMFGVGAAFDFHTGRLKDSPQWVKDAGLQWLHRLVQDPKRLWKRYITSNSQFLLALLWHKLFKPLAREQASIQPKIDKVR
ncbi:WecB/TagA/CpsF family glycosyltransferase [Terriglobus roseus]|uniref:N-acetylglucosaminyldiphosphoundecaprenol N-acetyl-beta-D-mannosaminyltransferase n=1 Tax=Terriglobus roseus TaxID=392734 RepID=A0A1G7KJI8_9BACT|nr:WecB/TagA/CpsF family glycosyltransferase [Terriglobus roseus]SDF37413.1 N-acetylglucosaminyldiphosphoundecaprenol N-acetyl-beta-D-mannosaminyltransferase [Terriglobus roseus]